MALSIRISDFGFVSTFGFRISSLLSAFLVGASLLCSLASPRVALGASGGVVNLPLPKPVKPGPPPKRSPRALDVSIDTTWVECSGYRPVRITVTPVPPLTFDRTLTVEFTPSMPWGGNPAVTVTQDIVLPANAPSVTATISVPQIEPWNSFAFELFDEGSVVEELSVPRQSISVGSNTNVWGDGASPNILFLGATKDPSPLYLALGRGNEAAIQLGLPPVTSAGVMRPSGIAIPMPATRFAGVNGIASAADLPTRWLDYSGLDMVYLSLSELKDLIAKHPQQWQAMATWVRTGGNLWVCGIGDKWEHMEELERLLEMPEPLAVDSAAPSGPAGWEEPDWKRRDEAVIGATRMYGGTNISTPVTSVPGSTTNNSKKQNQAPFVLRDLGQGQVVAFADDDPLTNNTVNWAWVLNTVGPHRWQWYRRHGVSFQRDNPEFWEFLIPGVGLAPVIQFQVLITLFVLFIGPVNFLLLRRWQKLNLLMITVPASAAFITFCLVAYALVADGLGIRARVRSFTAIDQRRKEAVCWARLSYYAGLSPSRGLTFPVDTTVYPVEHNADGGSYRTNRPLRRIDWRDSQDLTAGWLSARTPTQLLTVSTRATDDKLEIAEADGASPTVTNRLGGKIVKLVLVDESGKYFTGADVAIDGKTTLVEIAADKAQRELYALSNQDPLARPAGMNANNYGLFGVRQRYYYYSNSGTDLDAPSLRTGVLERGIGASCSMSSSHKLGPRTYVAVMETSPEVSIGVESAREESSFHVILGRW